MIVADRVVRWLCSVRAKRGSATATRYRRLRAIVATIVGILTLVSQTSAQSAPWHYDLRSGDHLNYRYTFHRQIDDKKEDEHSQTNSPTFRNECRRVPGISLKPWKFRPSEIHAPPGKSPAKPLATSWARCTKS